CNGVLLPNQTCIRGHPARVCCTAPPQESRAYTGKKDGLFKMFGCCYGSAVCRLAKGQSVARFDVNTWRSSVAADSGLISGDRMERRTFLNISGLAFGSMLVPVFGRAIAAEELLNPMAASMKKSLADIALNAATKAG